MAIIKPKKATRTANKTLSGSMKTPAFMPADDIQAAEEVIASSTPNKAGTRENAKTAVTKLIIKTK
jgi:hypothetical protein